LVRLLMSRYRQSCQPDHWRRADCGPQGFGALVNNSVNRSNGLTRYNNSGCRECIEVPPRNPFGDRLRLRYVNPIGRRLKRALNPTPDRFRRMRAQYRSRLLTARLRYARVRCRARDRTEKPPKYPLEVLPNNPLLAVA